MTRLSMLRNEADQRRQEFLRTTQALSERASAGKLLDELVGAADPALTVLGRVNARMKENPIVLLVAVTLFWALTSTRLLAKDRQPLVRDQSRRPSRLPTSRKGDQHGYFNTAND